MDEVVVRRLGAIEGLAGLVAVSPPMREVFARIPAIAASDGTALITGETGTGKELIARAIHYMSRRADFPFVPINCGALPEALIEAELFGHERGSFTGADARRVGLLKEAEGGTVCLDELDSLTTRGQVALLRVLQDRRFRAVGGSREQAANVRFIGVTNAPLQDLMHRGRFRADLYYRLCVFSLHVPPLRDRREDVIPLAEHFLRKHPPTGRLVPRLNDAARAALLAYGWPGNVRELENLILRAAQLSTGDFVDAAALGLPSPTANLAAESIANSFTASKRRAIETFEHRFLLRLMSEQAGNVSRAARAVGKDRRDLGKLLKKYGIDPKGFTGRSSPGMGGNGPTDNAQQALPR